MRCGWALRRSVVPGVEASQLFAAHRRLLLQDLAHNANDKSLAGRVDPLIAPVVSYINDNFAKYVTTSSCSGRIALFHRGKIEDDVLEAVEAASRGAPANIEGSESLRKDRKRGGFGRGTLFQSHDPLPNVKEAVGEQLLPALRFFWAWRQQLPPQTPLTQRTELLQLKFEPMILHVLCRDIDAAAGLLQCASESAQGNSGILSCSRGTQEHRKITCCVTSPLTLDIPLFSDGAWLLPVNTADTDTAAVAADTSFAGAAWTSLLTHALHRVNALFTENALRTERFRCELARRELPSPPSPSPSASLPD